MSEARIKILLDGSWTDWLTPEEVRKYEFTECVIQETMTREQYERNYDKINIDRAENRFKNGSS